MKIKKIPITKIHPNEHNPNRMSDEQYNHLKKEYQRVGYLQPVLVRPTTKDNYEIVDGEHRWRVAKEQGLKEIHCVIKELDDTQAQLTTLNMNNIKGDFQPTKFANLLYDLQSTTSKKTLSQLINIDETEIDKYNCLIDIPNPEEIMSELTDIEHTIKFKLNEDEYVAILQLVGSGDITTNIKQYLLNHFV